MSERLLAYVSIGSVRAVTDEVAQCVPRVGLCSVIMHDGQKE